MKLLIAVLMMVFSFGVGARNTEEYGFQTYFQKSSKEYAEQKQENGISLSSNEILLRGKVLSSARNQFEERNLENISHDLFIEYGGHFYYCQLTYDRLDPKFKHWCRDADAF